MYTTLLLAIFTISAHCTPTYTSLWPKPQNATVSDTILEIDPSQFYFKIIGFTNDVLSQGLQRYQSLIFYKGVALPKIFHAHPTPIRTDNGQISTLAINVLSNDETLGPETNETCTKLLWFCFVDMSVDSLVVAQPTSTLIAATVYGALRGLETFRYVVLLHVS